MVTTDSRPWFWSGAQGLEPSALVGDVRRGVRLRIRYRRAAESAPAWQLVDPYGLLAKAGRWYLVADRSGTPRLYSLERLTDWRPTAAPRRLRPGISLADAVAELTTGWETSADLRIHGLLAARHAERARRILGSRVTVHRPGEGPALSPSPGPDQVALTLSCRNLEEVRQLLPFGADLLITDPPEARTRLRELAAEVVGQYVEQDEGEEGAALHNPRLQDRPQRGTRPGSGCGTSTVRTGTRSLSTRPWRGVKGCGVRPRARRHHRVLLFGSHGTARGWAVPVRPRRTCGGATPRGEHRDNQRESAATRTRGTVPSRVAVLTTTGRTTGLPGAPTSTWRAGPHHRSGDPHP